MLDEAVKVTYLQYRVHVIEMCHDAIWNFVFSNYFSGSFLFVLKSVISCAFSKFLIFSKINITGIGQKEFQPFGASVFDRLNMVLLIKYDPTLLVAGPGVHPYHDMSNGVHPDHPQSPLQEVLTAEALAHSDVILAAKGIQDSRESVYNSINGLSFSTLFFSRSYQKS